jgi:GH15 family glucan-1,4-alpha-glucosidase
MRLEQIGLIGNCQCSALIDASGAVVWCCLPRFDSEPVFGALLDDEGGTFVVGAADGESGDMRYDDNTNVLETVFRTAGGSFRVVDFMPRFMQYDRVFRPTQLMRIVEPLAGTPRVRVACDPRLGWSRAVPAHVLGSNHVRWDGYPTPLRLTTDIPLSYLGGRPFALTRRHYLALTWGAAIEEPLAPLVERFHQETTRYWRRWVKHCDIPPVYQKEVIRSALALKLHCFEDTGAIIAAMTTSIPEAPGSGRTWDYRYCWLRDAFYVLDAFRLLGQFEEREAFVHFLLNVVSTVDQLDLAPLYRVDGGSELAERVLDEWRGFEGERPVRIGNEAAQHRQNDIFGELVLALSPIFLDDRMAEERSRSTLDLIDGLARKAIAVAGTPDAGIWEYRTEWQPQTFSSLMCWAAADRMATISRLHRPSATAEFEQAAERIREELVRRAWDPVQESFVASYGGTDLDAALLQLPKLRLLPPGDDRVRRTVDAIRDELSRNGWLLRYRLDDGFGVPRVAFLICTFWLVEALAATDRHEEARSVMNRVREVMSPLGLLSEDLDTISGRMWGNFPQAYSHVGLIHAAFAAAPKWSDLL